MHLLPTSCLSPAQHLPYHSWQVGWLAAIKLKCLLKHLVKKTALVEWRSCSYSIEGNRELKRHQQQIWKLVKVLPFEFSELAVHSFVPCSRSLACIFPEKLSLLFLSPLVVYKYNLHSVGQVSPGLVYFLVILSGSMFSHFSICFSRIMQQNTADF